MKTNENCPDCAKAKEIIQVWLDKQSHERCWYHPDLFSKLAGLFKLTPKVPPQLPPRKDFEEGCRRYQTEQYDSK